MANRNKLFLLALIIIITTNCKKEEPQPPGDPLPGEIAYIINEGSFQANNGTISKIDITNQFVTQTYFQGINGFKLGDIVQSIGETADKYFIVVNNSAKIEVVDKESFVSLLTIDILGSPRYFLAINDTLAYVTDLFAGTVHQINPENGNKYNGISVNGWSEQMERIGNEVYVTLYSDLKVGVIDIESQALVDSIPVDLSPTKMVKDKLNKLWVIGSVFGGASKLYKLNAENRSIESEWLFTDTDPINQLTIDKDGSNIYYAVGDSSVFRMDITETQLPVEPIITYDFQTLYGLNVNKDGLVFASQAFDFTQQGIVLVFENSGFGSVYELKSQIPSGIAPNGVVFTE